jgi:protein-L-isoaspartate O-methyltransferase
LLELHVIDRLEHIEQHAESPAELRALQLRATRLHRQWEADNGRLLQRLRERIRDRRYTREGLRRAFVRCAGPARRERGYDALDQLVAGLLDAGLLPDERAVREPEMVAYQPTPGRAILDLLERADIRAHDVLIDIGSGLGWVVILVALLSEARTVGVEFEPTYCEYARSCAAALNASRASFVRADAREASLANGTIFFLYTPFRGEMLQQVLGRLRAEAEQRPIRVCTFGPCTPEVATARWLTARGASSFRDFREDEVVVFDSLLCSPRGTLIPHVSG